MKNLQMTGEETKIIKDGFIVHNRLETLIKNNQKIDSVVVCRELKDLSIESVTIVKMLFTVETPRQGVSTASINDLIKEYLEKTSKIKLEITGDDLIKMGIKPGKQIGEILDKILEIKIHNPEMKKEDELQEAKALIKN